MSKIIGSYVIVKDNFNNVLVAQRKAKRNEPKLWDIFSRNIKGKESTEKCANRAIKEDLKTIIFDLETFKEYVVDDETMDAIIVYTGCVRERIVCHDNIINYKWINETMMDSYEFLPTVKDILTDFFNQ